MRSTSIKLRPFNIGGAFEIKLPSGKTVFIDPCLTYYRPDKSYTGEFPGGFTRENVEGADYIVLTHSHWDHDLDVGYLAEKFHAQVFCSAACAEEVLKYHHLRYDDVIPLYPNSRYTLEDFTLETYQGKHNPMGARRWEEDCQIAAKVGVTDHSRCDQIGNLDSLDVLLTTNTNFSLLMTGGRVVWNDIFDVCRDKRPNLLLRQAGMRENGEQVPPERLAALLVRYGAQLIFPFHHEVILNKYGKEWTDAYFAAVGEEVARLAPGMTFVNPQAWKWYDIGMDVAVSESEK